MADYSELYNTKLNAKEEKEFQLWVTDESIKRNRDVGSDLRDYDLRGFWKNQGASGEDGHMTDEYKKPNHPTFSIDSIYNGVDGNKGGFWGEDKEGRYFLPSKTNLKMNKPEHLKQYFQQIEPGVRLMLDSVKDESNETLRNSLIQDLTRQ